MSVSMKQRRLSLTIAASCLSLLAASLNACSSDEDEPGTINPGDGNGNGSAISCDSDDDCGSGSCGGNGRCTAMPPMGNDIGDGFPDLLDSDGLEPPDGGASCVKLDVEFDRVPPFVLLLIDQSSSMEDNFDNGKDRWNTLRDTLLDRDNSLLSKLQNEVRFGMVLYSSENGSENGATCPLLESSPEIKLGNFSEMQELLDGAEPVDDTPTAESVEAVTARLDAINEPGQKFLILATDGEPDTCADPNAQGSDCPSGTVPCNSRAEVARQASIAAVTAAFDKGITTRVISVGDEVGAGHLKALAVAGSGDDSAEAFTALNTEALEAAFTSIIGEARSCEFQLEGTVAAADAGRGTVVLDGQSLVFGDANGWSMPDERTVRIDGDACEALQQNDNAALSMDFPCGVYQVIPR